MKKNWKVYRHILRKEISKYDFDKYYYGITTQKINRRWRNGKGYLHNEGFTNDICKFGWDKFEHEVLFKDLTKEEAELLEQMYIKLYDTRNEFHGYNLEGGGLKGEVHDKTKIKLSQSKKGKNIGEDNPFYGKHHSKEAKEKIRKCKIGGTFSEEHKNKLSNSHKGKTSKKVINLDTGEIFNSMTEASERYNCHRQCIYKVCTGKRKTAGGYRWSYYED